jgi:hypothetical protein
LCEVSALREEFLVVVLAIVVRAFIGVLVDRCGAYVKECLSDGSDVPGELLSRGVGPWAEGHQEPGVGHAVY